MPNNTNGKRKEAETVAETLHGWMRSFIDGLLCLYMILVLVGLPFYFNEGYTYIATRKTNFFSKNCMTLLKVLVPLLVIYGITSAILYYRKNYTWKPALSGKELWAYLRSKVRLMDLFAIGYSAAVVLSYLFTDYRKEAAWGAGGWYMGFKTQLIMLSCYFLTAWFWKPRKGFFFMGLGASWVVFALGYLNRFSIYPIDMPLSSPGFISTIGNINWYCGYVTTVFFAGAAFLWQGGGKKWWQKVLLMLYVFTGYATLVTQGSAGGIATLGVILVVMFCLSPGDGKRMFWFWANVALLSAACLFTMAFDRLAPDKINFRDMYMDILITGKLPYIMGGLSLCFLVLTGILVKKGIYKKKPFQILAVLAGTAVSCAVAAVAAGIVVNTLHPGSLGKFSENSFFTFSDAWGSRRGATWKAGIQCFREQNLGHKIVGVGPDAMAAYIYTDGSEELRAMLAANFGDSRLTNVHNEWLTVLVDMGILGLAGFGGLMVTAIGTFLRKRSRNLIACACGLSLLAYTVNNIFSFEQIMNVTTMFLLMGMGRAFLGTQDKEVSPNN